MKSYISRKFPLATRMTAPTCLLTDARARAEGLCTTGSARRGKWYYRRSPCGGETQWFAGVWVDVEAGKVAARDVDANAVALLEDVGRGERLDGERVHRARLEQLGVVARGAISGADDGVGEIEVEALRPIAAGRVHVDEF